MLYESMVYISHYLSILAARAMDDVDFIWDVNSIKKFEVKLLLGKGRMKKVRGKRFIIYNTYNVLFFFIMYMIILI